MKNMIRRNNKGKKGIALFEIFLMVSATIAFAFILNSALVNAVDPAPFSLTAGQTDFRQLSPVASPSKTYGGVNWIDPKKAPTASSPVDYLVSSKLSVDNPIKADAGTFLKNGQDVGEIPKVNSIENVVVKGDGTASALVNGQQMEITEQGLKSLTEKGALSKPAEAELPFKLGKLYGGTAHLFQGLTWSLFVVGAIQVLGRLFGASDNLVNSLSIAAFAGIMSWKGILAGMEYTGTKISWLSNSAGFIGIGVGIIVFIMLYKESNQKVVTYECLPWEAPSGGKSCEKCDADPFKPCTEYRCKSLGQACQLLNPGTGNETCTWVSKFDVNSPTIKTNDNVLKPIGLKYIPDTGLRPGMTGVKIVDQTKASGCLNAFTKLEFGIYTNEPAQCKVETQHTSGIKDMSYYMGESNLYSYNHTQRTKLPRSPSINDSNLPTLNSDGSYSMYVRCQDANGNENKDEFVFSYCVDPSPDATPPVIEGTSISSGSYVRYAIDNVPVDVYTNEIADCRWSRVDEAYGDMKNNFNCNSKIYEVNANLQYTCSGNLTGVKDMEDNKFFFRCKDSSGNQNAQSYPFVLKGSQLLSVKNTAPNGTIYGSTSTTTVTTSIETSNGAENGKSTCYYYATTPSGTVNEDNFLQMYSTNDYVSKQDLDLIGGNYRVYFRCVDSGGNIASSNATFSLVVDKSAPAVTRVYRELPDALKVVTNEDAQCSYSLTTCNYNVKNGLAMIYANSGSKNVHLAQWKAGQTYYIKCSDFYGNEPAPDQCNIIAGAAQLSSAN
jgi:hypothetical protein